MLATSFFHTVMVKLPRDKTFARFQRVNCFHGQRLIVCRVAQASFMRRNQDLSLVLIEAVIVSFSGS
jgi:hypothetical protein